VIFTHSRCLALTGLLATATLSASTAATPTSGASYAVFESDTAPAGPHRVSDRHLRPGSTYHDRVRVRSQEGRSPYAGPALATTPSTPAGTPREPRNLTCVEAGPTSVQLSWDDPNGGSVGYEIERSAVGAFSSGEFAAVGAIRAGAAPGRIRFTDAKARPRSAYADRVRAVGRTGRRTAYAVLEAAPAVPTTVFTPADWPTPDASYLDPARGSPRPPVAEVGAFATAPRGDTASPTLSAPRLAADGRSVAAALSEPCRPLAGSEGFSLKGAAVADWSISGTTLTLRLAGHVPDGSTPTLSDTPVGASPTSRAIRWPHSAINPSDPREARWCESGGAGAPAQTHRQPRRDRSVPKHADARPPRGVDAFRYESR
jgi:hypothetical protein